MGKRPTGFAAMTPERRCEIAAMGGRASSRDRDHMAKIGQKGGEKISGNPLFMAAIGSKGGKAKQHNAKLKGPK